MANWKKYSTVAGGLTITISAGISIVGLLWPDVTNRHWRKEDIAYCMVGAAERQYASQINAGTDVSGIVTQSRFTARAQMGYVRDTLRDAVDMGGSGSLFWMDSLQSFTFTAFYAYKGNISVTNSESGSAPTTRIYGTANEMNSIAEYIRTLDSRTMGTGTTNIYTSTGFSAEPKNHLPIIEKFIAPADIPYPSTIFSTYDEWWSYVFDNAEPLNIFPTGDVLSGATVSDTRWINTNNFADCVLVGSNLVRSIAVYSIDDGFDPPGLGGETGTQTGANLDGFAPSVATNGVYNTVYNTATIWNEAEDYLDNASNQTNYSLAFDPYDFSFAQGRILLETERITISPPNVGTSRVDWVGYFNWGEWEDLSIGYPSDEAINTGLVSRIQVFVMVRPSIPTPLVPRSYVNLTVTEPDNARFNEYVGDDFDIGFGTITYTNITMQSTATTYHYYDQNLPLAPEWALFSRVADNNGATRPTFDWGVGANINAIAPAQDLDYDYTSSGDLYKYENLLYDNSVSVIGWAVVVDWDFSALNNSTYSPNVSTGEWITAISP